MALMCSRYPELSQRKIKDELFETAINITPTGKDEKPGNGFNDAYRVVCGRAARGLNELLNSGNLPAEWSKHKGGRGERPSAAFML